MMFIFEILIFTPLLLRIWFEVFFSAWKFLLLNTFFQAIVAACMRINLINLKVH